MTCPHCDNSVPMMAYWQATGLSGVVCPHCDSSLRPVYWRYAIQFILAGVAGNFEGSLLRAAGYGGGFAVLGVAITTFLVFAALAPLLLRLRVKEDSVVLLPHGKT
jgi:hypothetical protein